MFQKSKQAVISTNKEIIFISGYRPFDKEKLFSLVGTMKHKKTFETSLFFITNLYIMNRKVSIVLLGLCSFLYGYSQVSWNAKAGMNVSRATTDGRDIDFKPGYQLGVGMDYFFSDHWGLQPSLMLVSKGYKMKGVNYDYLTPISTYKMTENRIYLEMPVSLAYRFNISDAMRLVINGGGYISYGIGGKAKYTTIALEDGAKYNDNMDTFSNRTENLDAGLTAGTTLEFKNKYTIGVIGEWGLKPGLGDYSKNHTYGINVGYKF